MSISSGQLLEDVVRYVECDGIYREGQPNEMACYFAGVIDGWADPELSLWGWTCPFKDCAKEHRLPIDELPGF